jgi:four helix bundle protein
MRVYVLSEELVPDTWDDVQKLKEDEIMVDIAKQLYGGVTSISANIAEGYSRSSGRDRARIFEYALGSVRESMSWYRSTIPVIGPIVVEDRLQRLEEMRRMLLAIIPRERGRVMKKFEPPAK